MKVGPGHKSGVELQKDIALHLCIIRYKASSVCSHNFPFKLPKRMIFIFLKAGSDTDFGTIRESSLCEIRLSNSNKILDANLCCPVIEEVKNAPFNRYLNLCIVEIDLGGGILYAGYICKQTFQ